MMSEKARRLIGLTGGIATGKSTVAHYLANTYKLTILDADLYAREAVAPGTLILTEIFDRYGDQVQLRDSSLNRQALAEIIFNDSVEKAWLESKIHPYVRQRFESAISSSCEDTVLVIPLLFEADMTDLTTEIWVVSCSFEEQIKRLIQRDNICIQQAISRIKNQMPLSEKVARADCVLNNVSTVENLCQQIDINYTK